MVLMSTNDTTTSTIHAHTVGAKAEATYGLDVADIAKLVRKDVTAARKAGDIPADVKVSVRIDRYSMGQSINVRATLPDRPARVPISDPRSILYGRPDDQYPGAMTYTVEADKLSDLLNGIVDAYNWDNSDVMTDYFSSRFHGMVSIDGAVS